MRSTAIMSPTQFEVQKVRIEREANEAGMANDLAGLQTAIAKRLHCFGRTTGHTSGIRTLRIRVGSGSNGHDRFRRWIGHCLQEVGSRPSPAVMDERCLDTLRADLRRNKATAL